MYAPTSLKPAKFGRRSSFQSCHWVERGPERREPDAVADQHVGRGERAHPQHRPTKKRLLPRMSCWTGWPVVSNDTRYFPRAGSDAASPSIRN